MADRSGQQFETYRLLHPLGGGMFGDVYLAEDHRQRQVAIKVLHGDFDNKQLQNFLREVRIGLLRHPHIISVLDLGIEPNSNTPYIVMEYAAHGTLLTRHARGTQLPLATIIPYVKQIAAALYYAHEEKNIIHRDVKPENILIDGQGTIKIADFGISVISQSARTSLENPQGRAGTAWYMAPEQIQSKPSRASDQYALAIIVYEWLTGEPPFTGGIMEVWGQHLYGIPNPLPKTILMLSDELEAVIMKALAKNPKDRYPTIQDFAAALEEAYNKEVQRRQPPKFKPTMIEGKTKEQWFGEGSTHYGAKRYQEAIAAYTKAIELDPNYADAYYKRGDASDEQKRYEEAIRDYSRALELDPRYAYAYNGRGNVYKEQKRYEEAIRDYTKALELDPRYAYAYNGRGNVYKEQKRYEEAIRDYSKALELDPRYTDVYYGRGIVYKEQKRYEEAIRDYSKALELDPRYTYAYHGRGNAYDELKDYRRAVADYDRALELGIDLEGVRAYRDFVFKKLNKG